MNTGELTALNRRLADRFLRLACGPWQPEFGGNDWLVWLFSNEARMIGHEWSRAWRRESAARRQAVLDFGYWGG